jgi:hypothetical protein
MKILRLADGTRTIRQIADKLGIDRKPVYAAITWNRENGGQASFLPDRKRKKEARCREAAGRENRQNYDNYPGTGAGGGVDETAAETAPSFSRRVSVGCT